MTASTVPLPLPSFHGRLTNNDILFGSPMLPSDRLKAMPASEFEVMISEWGNAYLIPSGIYVEVTKCSGAGDKGRDVIAIVDHDKDIWDNYQCKHYKDVLAPSDVWIEIGKLVYYTFIKDYSVPRLYYFICPQGLGPKLNDLLKKPDELRKGLLENWDKKCTKDIHGGKSPVPLSDELKAYIAAFDFGIFRGYDPLKLIGEHQKTNYYAARFGGGLQQRRPDPKTPPATVAKQELTYTNQLFEAYSDHTKTAITDEAELAPHTDLKAHFVRQRESFYNADALMQFSRDNLPPETNHFEDLKDDVFTGVIDIHNKTYPDGYERLIATVSQAKVIQLNNSPLVNYIGQKDREGLCHHLANDKKLVWVKK